jgi:hypothetical protein
MKRNKKQSPKSRLEPGEGKSRLPHERDEEENQIVPSYSEQARGKDERIVLDKKKFVFEIEVGICEVDKIFEGQGDKLSDIFVCESLESLTKLIKENTFENYAATLKEGSDDESDMLHINIVNRLSSLIEELELQVTDGQIIDALRHVLMQVRSGMSRSAGRVKSEKSSRAYLDPLAKRLREMGLKTDFLAEADLDDRVIHLEDIDNLDDLSFDDDDLDLDDLRPKY